MRIDSYWTYLFGRWMNFNDSHPPIMSLLWALTDKIISGPGGMFLLHQVLIVYSLYLLSLVALKNGKRLFSLPFLGVFYPPVSCLIYFISKDLSLASFLLLGFSFWYFWRSQNRLNYVKMILIMAILFYSSAVRHNSLSATIPLILLFVLHSIPSVKKALCVTLVIVALFFQGNRFLTYTILNASKVNQSQILMAHDLMGIYAITRKNYFPNDYLSQNRLDEYMKKFDHRTLDATTFIEGNLIIIDNDLKTLSLLKKDWLTAISEQPMAYLRHRWILFRCLLYDPLQIAYTVSMPPIKQYSGYALPLLKETWLGKIHNRIFDWTRKYLSVLFFPLSYVLANCIFIVFAARRRIWSSIALSVSALLYTSLYFFFAPSAIFRYVYWAVFATLLSLFTLWIEWKSPRNEVCLDAAHES